MLSSVKVSELLRIYKSKIINDSEVYFFEYIENKNSGLKFVYLSPTVIEILNKRNGNFPKKISHQRYNEYIKIVCKVSGLDYEIEWG